MKKFSLSLWFVVLCALLGAPMAHAQSGITLTDNPAPEYAFGDYVTFQLSARSEARIKTINLYYRNAPGAPTALAKPRFIPGAFITATYTISLTLSPLVPYTTLEYWWELEDSADHTLLTEPQTFLYADNRFEWRTLSRAPINAHWYEGDTAFGQTAADAAFAALNELNNDLQAPLPEVVNIYIYANQEDAQAAFQHTGRAWVGAHASPALGVVIVAVSPDALRASGELGNVIPHELTHVLIYQFMGENYRHVPAWLNEGLARLNEAEPDSTAPQTLRTAAQAGHLLSLEALCQPFPENSSQALLAYAQSASVVNYLRTQHGQSKIQALLQAYADGLSCEAGVQQVLGVSLEALETGWLATINPNPVSVKLRPYTPWLALTLLILFSSGLFLLLTFRRAKTTPS